MRTHYNLTLLTFTVTYKDADELSYFSFKRLKKVLKRKDMIRIIHAVKANPREVDYITTEDHVSIHSIQWGY